MQIDALLRAMASSVAKEEERAQRDRPQHFWDFHESAV
jgi:hypothetical protein